MHRLRNMVRGITAALIGTFVLLAAGQFFALGLLRNGAQEQLVFTVSLVILGFCLFALIVLLAAGHQRVKNTWTEHFTEVAAKEQELAMERDRLDSAYDDLRKMGALSPHIGMHNQASVSNWLDSNFDTFNRVSVENLLDGERSTALLFLALDDVENLYAQDQQLVDAILAEMGQQLEQWVRQNDMVARWQDASFLLTLTYINLKDALLRAEDFRAALVENVVNVHGMEANVSVSCGMSMMLASDTSWRQSMERAKKALSRRKERGNNKLYHEIL